MKHKKKSLVLTLLLISLLVTGCWDNRELNDQALQLAVGFDWTKNNKYLLSNQFALYAEGSSSDNKGQSGFYTETAEGNIPMKAVSIMQSKVTRHINRGQRRSMVIGERFARRGFREILDYVMRNPESPMRLDLFIVRNGSAVDLLKSHTPFGGQSLREYYKLHQSNFGAVDVVFINLIRAMSEGDHSGFLLPTMERVSESSEKMKNQTTSQYRYAGGAVMNKEPRLIGYLNQEETLNALWINNIPHNHFVTYEAPDGSGTLTVQLKNLKRKWSMQFGDELRVSLSLHADVILVESTSDLDLLDVHVLEQIKTDMKQVTEEQMKSLIGKFQTKLKIDAIGVGDTIYRNHPKHWKTLMADWQRTFPTIDFKVKLDLKFNHFGLIGSSGHLKKAEVAE